MPDEDTKSEELKKLLKPDFKVTKRAKPSGFVIRKTKDRLDLYYVTMLCGTMAALAGYTVDLVANKDGSMSTVIDTKTHGVFELAVPALSVKGRDLTLQHRAIQDFVKSILERYEEHGKAKSQ